MTLLREAIGESLRRARVAQSRTLREVSTSARVSLGYLSEVERGRKEASSELLAAICQALDVPLSQVLFDVSAAMADADRETERTAAAPAGAAPASAAASGTGGSGVTPRGGDGAFGPRFVIPAPTSDRLVLVAAD
ncbi:MULTISPECIES: helix-turn-helix domain-containing protein [unclassified Nocardia]|uniref:helix-turn-helix domain-containing protein n=1 Tax=unclassified Nocardia TaxID=2637762 RepID=UPI00278BF4E5|nr:MULTISPECIES: helix-turn-helix transcriptional regulator [unclassified Nocardia]